VSETMGVRPFIALMSSGSGAVLRAVALMAILGDFCVVALSSKQRGEYPHLAFGGLSAQVAAIHPCGFDGATWISRGENL